MSQFIIFNQGHILWPQMLDVWVCLTIVCSIISFICQMLMALHKVTHWNWNLNWTRKWSVLNRLLPREDPPSMVCLESQSTEQPGLEVSPASASSKPLHQGGTLLQQETVPSSMVTRPKYSRRPACVSWPTPKSPVKHGKKDPDDGQDQRAVWHKQLAWAG